MVMLDSCRNLVDRELLLSRNDKAPQVGASEGEKARFNKIKKTARGKN